MRRKEYPPIGSPVGILKRLHREVVFVWRCEMEMGKGGMTPRSTVLTNEILGRLGEYKMHKQAAEESMRLAYDALGKAMENYEELNPFSEDTKPSF